MTTKAARAAYMRSYRAQGKDIDSRHAYDRAQILAAQWVKTHRPDVYDRMLAQAYVDTGGDRRAPGRPSKDAT